MYAQADLSLAGCIYHIAGNLMLRLIDELQCMRVCKKNLVDNCIQNFHLGRYIVGYTVGNLVLGQLASGAVKCEFRTYICALQIKVATDREDIFHFKLCVNKV